MATSFAVDSDAPVARTSPEEEYIAGGLRMPLLGGYGSIASRILEVTEQGGPLLADLMLSDEKISGSIRTIKNGILSQGMQITATVQINADDSPDDVSEADVKQAFQIEDHCERAWRNLSGSRSELLNRLLDAMAYRTMLAEVVKRVAESGPDEGKYLLDRIPVKDAGTWRFVRDAYGNTRGIQASTLAVDGKLQPASILPRDKFLILPWLPRGSNPWGQGLLGEAYNAWNFKVQLYPLLWKYAKLFAIPLVHASPGENAKSRPLLDDDGNPKTKDLPASKALFLEMQAMQLLGGNLLVTPNGTTLSMPTPAGDGEVFSFIFDLLDRAIVYAMHNTTLSLGEKKRSNGTDSATGQDLLALVISYGKWALKEMLYRDLWYPHVLQNWGPEIAQRFTPETSFGMTNPEDFSRNSNSIYRLWSVGLIAGEDERVAALNWVGLNLGRRKKSNAQADLSTQPGPKKRPINVKRAA